MSTNNNQSANANKDLSAAKPKTCYEAMNADPAYSGLAEQISEHWKQDRQLENDIREALWNVQAALRAADACVSLYCSEVSDEADSALKARTGEDLEAWDCNWNRSIDLIRDKACEICEQVAALNAQRKANTAKRKALQVEREALGDALRKAWHEAEEATEQAKP